MTDHPARSAASRAAVVDAAPVAVLFTDIVGSTELGSREGDLAAFDVFRHHREVVEDVIVGRGAVVKSTGDGLLVRFEATHDAVDCALEIRDRLAATAPGRIDVRYGVNVGPAREDADDLYGLDVTAAARIVNKASAGQVLVSGAVRESAAGSRAVFLDRGLFWLKGFPRQWRLYEAARSEREVRRLPTIEGQTTFVDRDDQRAVLRSAVDDVSAGRGRFVTIVGPRGAGKTRLAAEALDEAHARGLHVLRVNCHETDRTEALRPVAHLLDQARRALTDRSFRDLLGDAAGEVARVLPDLRQRYDDIPLGSELPPDDARRFLFRSVIEVLGRLAATRPIVALVDDIMWADEATADFVEQLAAQLAELQILLLATYASEDLTPARPLHRVLSNLHRRRSVTSVDVGGLDRDSVGDLLATFGRTVPPDDLIDRFHQVTRGEVYYLEELLRHLDTRHRLCAEDGSWLSLDALDSVDPPESLRLVIEQRLLDLRGPTRELLVLGAVIGREFSFDLLELSSDLDEDVLLDALDEAEHAHVLSSLRIGDQVVFLLGADMVAQALLSGVTRSNLQRLHLRVAEAIEELHGDALAVHAAEVARHLELAGRLAEPSRTAKFLRLAGERALEACAFATALDHLDRSLAANRAMPPGDRAAVLEGMAAAERSLGHYDEALAIWREAIELHTERGHPEDVARVCLEAAGQVAMWRRGRDVRELVERGLDALGGRDSAMAAGLLAIDGGVASQMADLERGGALLAEAVEVASRTGDRKVIGVAEYAMAVHTFSICDYERTVEAGGRSIDLLRASGDVWELANALGYVGAALGWLGRFPEAADAGVEARKLGERLGNWPAYVFGEQAVAFGSVGADPSADRLEERGRDIIELGEATGFGWLRSIGFARVGLANFWRGDWARALADFEASAAAEQRGASGGHAGRLLMTHAYLGNAAEALRIVDRVRDGMALPGAANTGTAWTLAASAVEAYAVLERRDDAAALYPTVLAHAGTGCLMRSWDYRLVETLCGVSAGCGGEWDVAAQHFDRARQQASDLPMRIEEAEVERLAGLVLLHGPPAVAAEARSRLPRAIGCYEELGMARHVTAARLMLDG